MYISNELNNCRNLDKAVNLISEGVCEGMEGIEFSSEMLAGQYAISAAFDCESITKLEIIHQLCFLQSNGAVFDYEKALSYAIYLAEQGYLSDEE